MLKSITQSALPVLALPRTAKRLIALAVDASLCVLTMWLAFYLRLGEFVALSGRSLWVNSNQLGIRVNLLINNPNKTVTSHCPHPILANGDPLTCPPKSGPEFMLGFGPKIMDRHCNGPVIYIRKIQ